MLIVIFSYGLLSTFTLWRLCGKRADLKASMLDEDDFDIEPYRISDHTCSLHVPEQRLMQIDCHLTDVTEIQFIWINQRNTLSAKSLLS